MKPIIGINANVVMEGSSPKLELLSNYFDSISKAGGIPIILPPVPDEDLNRLLSTIDGLLLTGGPDYNPCHYQEEVHPKNGLMAPMRDDFDMRLVQKAIAASNIPILGICAGCQALNIGLGGSLIQHIPDVVGPEVIHSGKGSADGSLKHKISFEPKTKLASIYGKTDLDVPTSHHQAVKKVGAGLKPAAYADDKIIEAVEYSDKPFVIGVQWHPERDFANNKKLFEEFVKHAAKVTPAAASR